MKSKPKNIVFYRQKCSLLIMVLLACFIFLSLFSGCQRSVSEKPADETPVKQTPAEQTEPAAQEKDESEEPIEPIVPEKDKVSDNSQSKEHQDIGQSKESDDSQFADEVIIIEGEKLPVKSVTGGVVTVQNMTGFDGIWRNDEQCWWTGANPGDMLTFSVNVPKAGKYEVFLQLTQAPDYAVVQFYFDDKETAGEVDLYAEKVGLHETVSLGTMNLSAGEHTLGVKIKGANKSAEPSYMFGLDYIELNPF